MAWLRLVSSRAGRQAEPAAGFSPAATSLGQPASGMVDKLLVRFTDGFHFTVLLGGAIAMLFCTLSPRACGFIVAHSCRFINAASWH